MGKRTTPTAATPEPETPAPATGPRRMWRPLGSRVILKPTEAGARTADGNLALPSGIVLPGTVRQPATTGVVVAVGPECSICVPEDLVMFVSYSGATIKLGAEKQEFLVLDEGDVLAVMRSEDEELPPMGMMPIAPASRGGLPGRRRVNANSAYRR